MKFYILLISLLLLAISALIESKPADREIDFEKTNEIDYDRNSAKRNEKENHRKKLSRQTESSVEPIDDSIDRKNEENDKTHEEIDTNKPPQNNNIPSLLLPLLQRWQFSPQLFLQDRLNQLKQSLENLGLILPANNATQSKQFATTSGLLHLVGLNDSGFYTDRFEPAGFLGGNGWFANKGGILGGPGAILSTGSLLTDYPTPYRK